MIDAKQKKIRVGLVEIGNAFGGQYYLPYSVGTLSAHAKKKLADSEDYEFSLPVHRRDNLPGSINYLSTMDIVFFSVYLWNFRVSLEIAGKLKEINRGIVIVFGGPQVPESRPRMDSFLKAFSFIDVACYGEGEMPFLRILESVRHKKWEGITSIGYRREDGSFELNAVTELVGNINDIPSPYLADIFGPLIVENPGQKWSALLETNRGCPFTCAFCCWGKKNSRKVIQFDIERVYAEIDWFSRNLIEFVFCCDANFGMLRRDIDIARKVADNKKQLGFPHAFSVQNTKNAQESIFNVQKILNDSGLQKGVNLALQSLNRQTLQYIERSNIDNNTYGELQKRFAKNGIQTFTDLIIGLPGETYDSFADGVSEIIKQGQHNRIQFINLTILENTLMAMPEYQSAYGLDLVEADFAPHHASISSRADIAEKQTLVVGTQTMPQSKWIEARVFGWTASLLHFDKLLQIPFIVFAEAGGVPYRTLFESFISVRRDAPIMAGIVDFFEQKAVEIAKGGSEYCAASQWLDIMWYPDELALIELCSDGKLNAFYLEAHEKLSDMAKNSIISKDMITQAVNLNQAMLKQPFMEEDNLITLDYNIREVYQAALKREKCPVRKCVCRYVIDRTSQRWNSWDDWCREVIWYGNKKGDYLYKIKEQS